MKSYTDIEQSKKLAEFLPLESSDMYYLYLKDNNHIVNPQPFVADGFEEREEGIYTYLNCWSLAALLKYLSKIKSQVYTPVLFSSEDKWVLQFVEYGHGNVCEVTRDNPVNACYEMIIKLHELK